MIVDHCDYLGKLKFTIYGIKKAYSINYYFVSLKKNLNEETEQVFLVFIFILFFLNFN